MWSGRLGAVQATWKLAVSTGSLVWVMYNVANASAPVSQSAQTTLDVATDRWATP